MKTRNILILVVLTALIFSLGACMDDDDVKDGVDYTVHLVNPGDGFNHPVHQRTVHSSSADVTWTIN